MPPSTRNFSAHEFRQRARHGFDEVQVPEELYDNLARLMAVCQVIRDSLGVALVVKSGYRSDPYNTAIGGADDSKHETAEAADLVPTGRLSVRRLARRIRNLHAAGELPELGGLGVYDGHVHVDVRDHKPGQLAKWDQSTRTAVVGLAVFVGAGYALHYLLGVAS